MTYKQASKELSRATVYYDRLRDLVARHTLGAVLVLREAEVRAEALRAASGNLAREGARAALIRAKLGLGPVEIGGMAHESAVVAAAHFLWLAAELVFCPSAQPRADLELRRADPFNCLCAVRGALKVLPGGDVLRAALWQEYELVRAETRGTGEAQHTKWESLTDDSRAILRAAWRLGAFSVESRQQRAALALEAFGRKLTKADGERFARPELDEWLENAGRGAGGGRWLTPEARAMVEQFCSVCTPEAAAG